MIKIKKSTQIGIFILFVGIISGIYANTSTYIDTQGFLHENLSTPISAFSILIGTIIIIFSLVFNKKQK